MSKLEKVLGPNLNTGLKYEPFEGTHAYTISTRNSRFRFPSTISESIGLTNKYFVIQLYKRIGENVNITLNMYSDTDAPLRVQFLSSNRSPRTSQATLADQLDIKNNTWTNICFDLDYIASSYFNGCVFKKLASFEIMPTTHIRWIYGTNTPIYKQNNGNDLPDLVKYNGLTSQTILICDPAEEMQNEQLLNCARVKDHSGKTQTVKEHSFKEKTSKEQTTKEKVSKIPIRRRTTTTSSGRTRPKLDRKPKTPKKVEKKENKVENSDSDSDSDEAFGTRQSKPIVEIKKEEIDNSEEEFELIYIDALECYYCPSNQQYYQVDESKVL